MFFDAQTKIRHAPVEQAALPRDGCVLWSGDALRQDTRQSWSQGRHVRRFARTLAEEPFRIFRACVTSAV